MKKTKSRARRKRDFLIRSYVAVLSLILVLSVTALLSQTAFATAYVINDGDRMVTATTFVTDPAEVLGQAGVPLEDHDTYTTEATDRENTIPISYGQRIAIHNRGKTVYATSHGETVLQLLKRLGVELTDADVLSRDRQEETFDGMELSIDRIITCRETFSATLPREIQYQNDETLPLGMERILSEGQDGELLRTADITYVNGVETHRSIRSETILQKPVPAVIGIGKAQEEKREASQSVPVIGDGYITLPTGEVLTYTRSDTVEATAYTHTDAGCDMTTATGTTVRWGTVAVDPTRIPYGTRMFIIANDGSYVYGIATAEDCGGDIKGDRMDLYMPTYQQCREFGRRRCTLYFLG